MTTVLVYSRPAWRSWWWMVADKAFKGSNLVGLSEFKNKGDINVMDRFYRLWSSYSEEFDISQIPVEQVRLRCRLLNKLPKPLALRMIACAWQAINEILDEVAPQYVLSMTIDSYVMDLLSRAAKLRGIRFIGISNCPIPGYSLVSERGEHNVVREPSTAEVDQVRKVILADDFKPKYMIGDKSYSMFDHAKRVVYFKLKKIFNRLQRLKDPYNYNLMVLPYAADKKRFRDCLINQYFDRDPLVKWGDLDLPKLYIPLHFVPEATVNYWTPNLDFIDYENALLKTVGLLSEKFSILVKEHPAAMGTRNPLFYQNLKNIPNISLVHADFHSNTLIENCDAVLTWTGTVGFESALRKKRVVVLGYPYYYKQEFFTKVNDFDELSALNDVWESSVSGQSRESLVVHVLSGTLRGTFGQKGYLCKDNAIQLGESIKNYIGSPGL